MMPLNEDLGPTSMECPVLKINDHATGGRRTKDILGGPKGWGPKKKVANVEIYVIFEVFAFCGRRTKTDFKDRGRCLWLLQDLFFGFKSFFSEPWEPTSG